jgi:sigma-B regulation protein RsbU (phosphoserine phosphatase)
MWTFFNLAILVIAIAAIVLLVGFGRLRTRRLKERLHELQDEEDHVFEFLHGIGAAFSEGVRSIDLHRLIVESSTRIMNSSCGALYLANKADSGLTPSFIQEDCPALIEVPEHIRQQQINNPTAIRSFLQLQPVDKHSSGPVPECWRTGEIRIIRRGESGLPAGCAAIVGPLIYRRKILGVLVIATLKAEKEFTEKDLKVFRAIAEQSAFALYNEAVYLEAGEKKLMDRDLEIARDIQRILLPEAAPEFAGYELSGLSLAARHLSGDYFDYIPLDANRLAVAIADVSGKGVPASLIMAMCRSVLRREATDSAGASASNILRQVNHHLYPDIKEDMFISMAYVILDGAGGQVSLARAGHDAPLLYRAATTEVEKLSPKGMALGIDSGEVFNRVCADLSLVMEPGDCMLLYTDGATEATNHQGVEYGVDRLIQALRASASHGASEVLRHLAEDVRNFTGHDLKHDDFTLIAISKK